MKITCPQCNASYNIPTKKIPQGRKASATCKKCGEKIVIDFRVEELKKDRLKAEKTPEKDTQPEKPAEKKHVTDKQTGKKVKEKKKKSVFFKTIETIDEANAAIKGVSYGFIFVAIFKGVMGVFLNPDLIIEAVVTLILALLLMFLKSRIVAVLLLIFSLGDFVENLLIKVGIIEADGINIFLASIVVCISIKAVEATFKLHGKFKKEAG